MADDVSEQAISVIEDIVRRIRAESFVFRGEARFSTYLWSTLRQARRRRTYVPRAVAELGEEAEKAFHLLYVERREPAEVRQLLQAELGIGDGRAGDVIRLAQNAVGGSGIVSRLGAKQEAVVFDHTDAIEQAKTVTVDDEPSALFLKDVLRERAEIVLESLEPEEREIIMLHYVAGVSIREIGRRLDLRSPQYRFDQARKRFLELAESLDLRGVYDAAMGEG